MNSPQTQQNTNENAVRDLRITEIFYSIQGEAASMGRPCIFIRLSRCNLRCTWCDTTYSFKGGDKTSFVDIMQKVKDYKCNLVEITGGEPLLQPAVHELMTLLCDDEYEVMIETSGSLDVSKIDKRVAIIMDLKAPGSGEVEKNLYANLDHLKAKDEVKFVLLNEEDYNWAKEISEKYDLYNNHQVIFSPVFGELDPHTLSEWILSDHLNVRLGLQIHKYLEVE